MEARDIMSAGIISIKRDASVEDAMKAMMDRRVTSLVVDRDAVDENYGILTRKDIINKIVADGKDPGKVKVRDIMSEPLLCISPNSSVKNIAQLMEKTNVRRLAVIEGEGLIGMISNSDILRAMTLGGMQTQP